MSKLYYNWVQLRNQKKENHEKKNCGISQELNKLKKCSLLSPSLSTFLIFGQNKQ
jgi:hypothetical protein